MRAREAIRCGSFVCEYIGEVIDEKEANERRKRCEFLFSRFFVTICHVFYAVLSCYDWEKNVLLSLKLEKQVHYRRLQIFI